MALAYLTLFTGLAISAVAIYYSVAGLAAIFAAAAIPVVIMGTVLEVSKLVAALWLKWNWYRAPSLLKYYLLSAVVVLMIITSIGIFGFLSKAHVEQTAKATQGQAQIQQLDQEIERRQLDLEQRQQRVQQLETQGSSVDVNIQSQIDQEQQRIDRVLERTQPAIDQQQAIIDRQIALYNQRIQQIEQQIALLEAAISSQDIAKAQSIVGAEADGRWGPQTARAVREWQLARDQERQQLINNFDQAVNQSPAVIAAQQEIQRLRQAAEQQIADSNQLIARLRSQLGQASATSLESQLEDQQTIIAQTRNEIQQMSAERFELATEYRKLEAEVGPIKYIAQFVYGHDAGQDLLERAVTWLIIVIIIVFDPLAVLLLLASQWSFQWSRPQKTNIPIVATPVINPTSSTPVEPDPVPEPIVESDTVLDPVPEPVNETDDSDEPEDPNEEPHIKSAKAQWKADHPTDSLKHQRKLLELGLIDQLPWLIPPYIAEASSQQQSAD